MDNLSQNIYFKLVGIYNKDTCYKLKDKTWLFSIDEEFGIGVEHKYNENNRISEWANNLHFSSQKQTFLYDNEKLNLNLLCLTTTATNSLQEFAYICTEFTSDRTYELLSLDPLLWWDKWKELLGNSILEFSPTSILAEMIILIYLNELNIYDEISWKTNTKELTHDITSKVDAHEVKSTLMRYDNIIHISGQHQLKYNKPLYLYFCRFEETTDGIYSLALAYKKLVELGYEQNKLDKILKKMNIDLNANSSKKKYNILEIRKYLVDDKFPKIEDRNFKGGKIPTGIISLSYSLELSNIPYQLIKL